MPAATRIWIGRGLRSLGILALLALMVLAWGWRQARRELVSLALRQPPAWVRTAPADDPRPAARASDFPPAIARAMAEYSAGHHALALVTLEAYLEDAPHDAEAHFHAGVAALAVGSGRRALAHLGAVPEGVRYSEAARFYAAQAHLLAGHREEARRALEQAAGGPGRYCLQAATQLERLDDLPRGWRAYRPGRN